MKFYAATVGGVRIITVPVEDQGSTEKNEGEADLQIRGQLLRPGRYEVYRQWIAGGAVIQDVTNF
jgi:hypothetical protein